MNKKNHSIKSSTFLLFIFTWNLAFFLMNSPALLEDYDTYWHITAGKWILEKENLILPNSWSFSSPDHYWYNISWLWDLLSYFLFNKLGGKGLFFFSCLINSATITISALYLKQKTNINNLTILFSIFLLSLVIWDFAVSRPQIVTYLFCISYMLLTELYNSSKEKKYLFALPLIMVIWANMHGGFVAGCLILIFRFLENWKKSQQLKKLDWVFFTFCTLTALAIFINPYHYKILYAVTSTTASSFTQAIDEWQAYRFGNKFFTFSAYLFLFIISFDIRNKQISFIDKLNALLWLFMSLLHVRNIPIFAILSISFFATNFQNLNILRKLDIQGLKNKNNLIYGLSFISLITLFYCTEYMPDKINPKKNPKSAINFLIKNYPNNNFLNDYSLGGAMIFYGNGKQKVFVDGRAGTAYSDKTLKEYLDLSVLICQKNYEIIKKYKIKGFILSKEHAFHQALKHQNEWRKIYSDKDYIIYKFVY